MARWIRWTTRLAIYHRDKFRCVWCGKRRCALSLDHVVPRSHGGMNFASNLVTSCVDCNNLRGRLSLVAWLVRLDGEEVDTAVVSYRLSRSLNRPVDRERGHQLCRERFGRLV